MSYLFIGKMPPTGLIITGFKNTVDFILSHTPPDFQISSYVKEVAFDLIVPRTLLYNSPLFSFGQVRWKSTCNQVIGNVSVPWGKG